MRVLWFRTPYGQAYCVNERGQIYRQGVTPSDGWRMIGILEIGSESVIRFQDLAPERIKHLELIDRRGDPAYTVLDFDHGYNRVWGNTRSHGISAMAFVEV